jgi:hypothetical protein
MNGRLSSSDNMKIPLGLKLFAIALVLYLIIGSPIASTGGVFDKGKSAIISGYKNNSGFSQFKSSSCASILKPDFYEKPDTSIPKPDLNAKTDTNIFKPDFSAISHLITKSDLKNLISKNTTKFWDPAFTCQTKPSTSQFRYPSKILPQWLTYDPLIATMISQIDESEIYQTTYDLQNFTTRVYPSSGNTQAASYLYNRLNSIPGLQIEYQGTKNNVIATLPGKNTSSDTIFIVGAHYDSTSSNPALAPGATDNGCGVAIVLELARIMSQYEFNNTIKFAFWNGEETEPDGSEDFVTDAIENTLNIPLYFNFDSSTYDPDNQYVLDIMYNEESTPFADLLTQYNSLYHINFKLTYNVHSCSSDHRNFWESGYPAIMTHAQTHAPQAHTPNDTVDLVSLNYARKNGQLGMSILAKLAEIQHNESV